MKLNEDEKRELAKLVVDDIRRGTTMLGLNIPAQLKAKAEDEGFSRWLLMFDLHARLSDPTS